MKKGFKMAYEIIPVKNISGTIEIPGSKSYTARAILISALADGKCILKKPLFCDDTKYMSEALIKFGIKITKKNNSLIVYGNGGKIVVPQDCELFIGSAGTAARFLTAFCSICRGKVKITGDKRMSERPIKPLTDALFQLKAKTISSTNGLPVEIEGGSFEGGACKIKGDISSQFISALLMIAPYAKNDVIIEVEGDVISKPYIDITIDIMNSFGISVNNSNYKRFQVKSGQIYKPCEYTIESDASTASYFFAASAITNGHIIIKNINYNSKQGDIKFVDILEKMGCIVKRHKNSIELAGTDNLNGIEIDMNSMPDCVQTLCAVACFAKGTTTIKNIKSLRVKETDRINAVVNELRKVGINAEGAEDKITINPGKIYGNRISTYNDHRMAMSFSLIGLKEPGIIIENPDCVSKSFPAFWEKLKELGVRVVKKND